MTINTATGLNGQRYRVPGHFRLRCYPALKQILTERMRRILRPTLIRVSCRRTNQ
jgi:hypothetical protein